MTQASSIPHSGNSQGVGSYGGSQTDIDAEGATGPKSKGGFAWLGSVKRSLTGEAVSAKLLLVVTSQLSVMLAAGCDLCAGLDAMAKQQAHPQLKKVMADLHMRVKQGQSFSSALAHHPDVFSDLYVTMVRAGESGGLLRQMLSALQIMIRNNIRIVSSIRGALMYPVILMCVACGAILVMTTFVLPRFANVFRQSNVPLPPITKFVIGSSEFLAHNMIWLAFLMIAGFVGALWLIRHPAVRNTVHKWTLKIPFIGETLRLAYVAARFRLWAC